MTSGADPEFAIPARSAGRPHIRLADADELLRERSPLRAHWARWWAVWVAAIATRIGVLAVGVLAQYVARSRGIQHLAFLRAGTYVHYADVVAHGYNAKNATEFPLLPALLWAGHGIGIPLAASSLIVQTVCFALGIAAFAVVSERFVGHDAAVRASVLLAIFPTAYWFSLASTESAMLATLCGAAYLATRRHWLWAGAVASLCALTRPPAGFVVVILAATALGQWRAGALQGWRVKASAWIAVLLPAVCDGAFFLYLRHRTGDALATLHAQSSYNRHMSMMGPMHAVSNAVSNLRAHTYGPAFELAATLVAVAVLVWLVIRLRPEQVAVRWEFAGWIAFAALSLLAPLATGVVWQMPRFILLVPPVFWALGLVARRAWIMQACLVLLPMAFAFKLTFEIVGVSQ